ncbi:MAG: type I glyceraldehyde-3-phosphate dehydrogenase [Gammaproteobacteria bacterium]|nr:type I glyceraldehyde-3-phosphate dehydrogenase [Gammaproteobacteria bacterium]MCY3689719.1 type I glyceraldehyde-3-phosphate dehydrogenase [Gammaproteobacteria bacterium]MDE0480719.1 type I glyceraldehyde-3-phosphate dehydrogenase [Gammaproteobacteria bacterium]MXX07486.1 type I glyceraldehyde-3-phosphate dehydrogenase [Gammaproteobacteria bacterium]MYE28653.1 type I glyceraldehyde-3-phosphate dehydrogenase [Gammaproteobacteria bacterium]
MRVAINGFGRIGRAVFRIAESLPEIEIVAINDLFDNEALRYLLNYDTVMGRFPGKVSIEDSEMVTPRTRARMLQERDPTQLPWKELEVDVVVESTGVFRSKAQVSMHLEAGAGRALLTVPAKDEIDYTVVMGVNEEGLAPEHRIVSNASCTTNCLAPVAKVLHDAFGIREGIINTVHAYTNDQSLADVPHSDWRRSRAAAENIIPTSTGAAKAVGEVLPELNGRLDGIASRVPVPDGSVVDLFAELEQEVTVEQVNEAVRSAARSERMRNVLEYTEEPVVSSDIIGNPHSSIFDASFTQVGGGRYLKALSWYDNEWGYSQRVCDVLGLMSS